MIDIAFPFKGMRKNWVGWVDNPRAETTVGFCDNGDAFFGGCWALGDSLSGTLAPVFSCAFEELESDN